MLGGGVFRRRAAYEIPAVIPALSIATAGLSAAASRAAGAAAVIAAPEQTADGEQSPSQSPSPRVGYLPLPSDPLAAFSSLMEAELSFKANAAVIRTAVDMVEALYKAVD
jgi:hypothetical protein